MNSDSDSADGYNTESEKAEKSSSSRKNLKKEKRVQKYRKAWENEFKGWLKPDERFYTKAKCTVCDIKLKADITNIRHHSNTTQNI